MEYPGDHWLGYDRRFRQRAAVTKTTKWSKIDTTLWHLAFAGRPSIARCEYCFSITHCSRGCELAPDPDRPAPTRLWDAPTVDLPDLSPLPPGSQR